MRKFRLLCAGSVLLVLAGCAQPGPSTGSDSSPSANGSETFNRRAVQAAAAFRQATTGQRDWTEGYVPVQEQTLPVGDPGFDPDTRQAFVNGWYRQQIDLPAGGPENGVIQFPDGTLDVPLIGAAEAYRQLDKGDPPPCAHRLASPPPAAPGSGGPDNSVSAPGLAACVPLTVTRVAAGTVQQWTSRGAARVPAWLFTVEELAAPIAQVAVAPAATGEVPEFAVPGGTPARGLVAVQRLTSSDGTRLSFELGVGACDTDIEPLVYTDDDVVVIGGAARSSTGLCTDQLLLKPVTVTLAAPPGARPVLDAVTGRVLLRAVR